MKIQDRAGARQLFLAGALVILGCQPALPQAAPSVEALVAEALDRSPSVAALEARLAAAHEMVAPAGALPDPMVEAMLQDVGFPRDTVGREEMSMRGLEVRQGLPSPGKLRARRDVATAEVGVRERELDALRRTIAASVRLAFARIYALDRESASLGSARQLLDILTSTVPARYSAGEVEQEAVIKAQLELSRLHERLADIGADRAAMVSVIDRLLDRPGDSPLGEVVDLPEVVAPGGSWEELALAGSADIAVKKAAVAVAERRVALARTELKPDFKAAVTVGERGEFDPVVTLGLGVELPLWKRRKQLPMLRAAEAELEMARHELREAQAMARSEAARLEAQWQRAERVIHLYEQAIVPQTSSAIDAARAGYLAGRGDFSVVIEDFNLWLDARVELARRQADRYETWVELAALAHAGAIEPERE